MQPVRNHHYPTHQNLNSQGLPNENPSSSHQSRDPPIQESRLRVHSYQQNPLNENQMQKIIKERFDLDKIKSHKSHSLKQSNGIMNQPPDFMANRYTFKNQHGITYYGETSCSIFGACCSLVRETQREVYLSPTQLITMSHFAPSIKPEAKSLRFQRHSPAKNEGGHKSFFKEMSNVVQ